MQMDSCLPFFNELHGPDRPSFGDRALWDRIRTLKWSKIPVRTCYCQQRANYLVLLISIATSPELLIKCVFLWSKNSLKVKNCDIIIISPGKRPLLHLDLPPYSSSSLGCKRLAPGGAQDHGFTPVI